MTEGKKKNNQICTNYLKCKTQTQMTSKETRDYVCLSWQIDSLRKLVKPADYHLFPIKDYLIKIYTKAYEEEFSTGKEIASPSYLLQSQSGQPNARVTSLFKFPHTRQVCREWLKKVKMVTTRCNQSLSLPPPIYALCQTSKGQDFDCIVVATCPF